MPELTLIKELGRDEKSVLYGLYKCYCGKEWKVRVASVKSGNTKSCGCGQRKAARESREKHITHGMSGTSEYNIWRTMKARCKNPNHHEYHLYGGRGIAVCERWTKFVNFFEDMGEKPGKEYSIDRINNDGNYEPENCKWSTPKEQCRHTRKNRKITFNGITKNLIEWAEETGIDRRTIQARIDYYGWSIEKTLTTPKMKNQHG